MVAKAAGLWGDDVEEQGLHALLDTVVSLLGSNCAEIRTAALRLLRYCGAHEKASDLLFRKGVEYGVLRSLELDVHNSNAERMQAMELLRLLLRKNNAAFPTCLVAVLVAIADSAGDGYKMVALESLCELVSAYLKCRAHVRSESC